MKSVGKIMGARRAERGISQGRMAELLGIGERQVRKYEGDEQQFNFSTGIKIAKLLGISVAELAGELSSSIDLSGPWFAAWETTRDRVKVINRHRLTASQSMDFVGFTADGDYIWSADMRLFQDRLDGRYSAIDAASRNAGTFHFWLAADADAAIGRWSGEYADGPLGWGWGVLAREEARAERLMATLLEHPETEPLTIWPEED